MARKNLLEREKVSPILPYETLSSKTTQTSGRGHLSLSGAQIKYSAVIENGVFRLTEPNERGTYIFNSKDICMVEYVPDMIKAGVNSFKIEGRIIYIIGVNRFTVCV